MDQLNDDCQLCIINYLELNDQLALWKATKNLSLRWNTNICRAWQQQHSYVLDWVMYDLEDDPEMMDTFLSSICNTLNTLKLEEIRLDHLQLWCKYKYSNMRELEYWLDEYEDPLNSSLILELLTELFPTVSCLKLYGEFHSLRIDRFKELRRLDLLECSKINNLNGSETLEELNIEFNFDCIDFNISSFKCFPKLQTLSFKCQKGSEKLLDNLLKERSSDIVEISFRHCIWLYDLIAVHLPKSLSRLSLIEKECSFTVTKLPSLVAQLPLLQQLDLVDFQFFSTELSLWKMVMACPSLKTLSISGIQLYEDFFEISRSSMHQALTNRPVPLSLHCHNTGAYKHLVSITKSGTQLLYFLETSFVYFRSRKTLIIPILRFILGLCF